MWASCRNDAMAVLERQMSGARRRPFAKGYRRPKNRHDKDAEGKENGPVERDR